MYNKLQNLRNDYLKSLKEYQSIFTIETTGESMMPIIQPNSLLKVKGIKIENIRVGDIIVFYNKNGVSCHRCIYRNRNKLVERGDNCSLGLNLNTIYEKQLIGKVISIEDNDIDLYDLKRYTRFVITVGNISWIVGKIFNRDSVNLEDRYKQNFVNKLFYSIRVCLLKKDIKKIKDR